MWIKIQKFQGVNITGSESSIEHSPLGANVPKSESSRVLVSSVFAPLCINASMTSVPNYVRLRDRVTVRIRREFRPAVVMRSGAFMQCGGPC